MFAPSSSSAPPSLSPAAAPEVRPVAASAQCARGPIRMSDTDFLMQHYVYPAQFISMFFLVATVIVRILRAPRSHMARQSLIIIAVLNILTFMCMLPRCLNTFEIFYSNESYRRFYYETDIALNAFGNFFSAVDSFLVVVVSLEYYWFSANSPLVKVFVSRPRFTAILAALVTLAVSLTFVHLVEYETVNTIRCNGTKMFHSIKPTADVLPFALISVLHVAQAIFVVILPTVLVCFFNFKTLCLVRSRKRSLLSNEHIQLFGEEQRKGEKSAQVMYYLPAITVCFAFTHVASLFPFVFQWLLPLVPFITFEAYAFSITVLNSILLSGKIATFGLLYASSTDFVRTGILSAR